MFGIVAIASAYSSEKSTNRQLYCPKFNHERRLHLLIHPRQREGQESWKDDV